MYDIKNYKPFIDVSKRITSRHIIDWRLATELWPVVGPKIEVDLSVAGTKKGFIEDKIDEMFSTSPFAYDFLLELLKYSPQATTIKMVPCYLHSNPKQISSEILVKICSAKIPQRMVLFLKPQCHFMALLSATTKEEFNVYFWLLESVNYNPSEKIIENFNNTDFMKKISIINFGAQKEEVKKKIENIFCKDTISEKLKSEIVKYAPNTQLINVKMSYAHGLHGKQYVSDILYVLKTCSNQTPYLIVESGSNYACVICRNPDNENNVDLYVWDLNNCL